MIHVFHRPSLLLQETSFPAQVFRIFGNGRKINYQRIYDNSINFKTKIFRRFRNKKTSKKLKKCVDK